MKIRLPFVKGYRDRHGQPRFYFRRRGFQSIKLPTPGTPEFLAVYHAALDGTAWTPLPSPPPKPTIEPGGRIAATIEAGARVEFIPGTIGWLIEQYLGSAEYKARAASTQRSDRYIFDLIRLVEIEGFRVATGLLRDLEGRHIKKLRNHFRNTATALVGDRVVNAFSVVWQWADKYLDLEHLGPNPTAGIARLHVQKSERQPWTDEVFTAFEAHAPGHLRLCVALCLYTGQRISDVVKMRWSQFDGDSINDIMQQKTGALVTVPCHRDLRVILASVPRHGDTILVGERGDCYAASSPSIMIRRIFKSLGIVGYSVHGLRKNAVKNLTELGCSPQLVQAITGHQTVGMALHYGKQADQKKRARLAMDTWEAADDGSAPTIGATPLTFKPLPKRRLTG